MTKQKLRRIWTIVVSATGGFLLAAFLFIPQLYSNNQNVYKVLKDKIGVLQQIISYINLFYFDTVDMEKENSRESGLSLIFFMAISLLFHLFRIARLITQDYSPVIKSSLSMEMTPIKSQRMKYLKN